MEHENEPHRGVHPGRYRCGALVGHTLDGRVLFANDTFCEQHNVSPDEVTKQEPWFWSGIKDPERRREICAAIVEHGHYSFDAAESPDVVGGPWRIEAWLATLDGEPIIVSALFDMTEQHLTSRALDFSSMLLDQVNDAVVCHTLDGRIIYVNEAACRERGYTREEFLTLNVRDLIAPDTRMRYGDVHEDLMRDGTVVFESDDVKADGTRMVVEVKARLVEIDGEPVVVSIARDISERKQAQEAVERIAFTDPLTGLPNRRALMDRLEVVLAEAAATGELVMVAFLDLDYFKDVNDRFGHAVGDAVLELAAMRLSANVRAEDMVGRLGGDEFVVVASGLDDRKDVDRIAAKLVAVFGEPFDVDGTQVSSAVSVGVALNEPREISVIDVLANADLAMYTAKDRGRCRYAMYVPAMRAPAPLGSAESGAEQPVS